LVLIASMLPLWTLAAPASAAQTSQRATDCCRDASDGRDWPGYGRTLGQQHYSPLAQIDDTTVSRLGRSLWTGCCILRPG
jgi:glucose dehydrogenase